ncbi:MAG TPA: hypothetical protein VK279_14060 [Solirubrobacteraceae bacterium]|nr:hypothetical protein [Solirubrobacteraceae bacterium]
MTVFAAGALGALSLVLCYAWLLSAIVAGVIAKKKGYPEKWGVGTGLLLTVVGVAVWGILYFVLRDGPQKAVKRREGAAR